MLQNVFRSGLRRWIVNTVSVVLVMVASTVSAQQADEPGTWEMTADAVIARPLGLVVTTVGVAAFVASLPFSALGGNVVEAADTLVVDPAKATFVRCLGCRTTGRLKEPDAE